MCYFFFRDHLCCSFSQGSSDSSLIHCHKLVSHEAAILRQREGVFIFHLTAVFVAFSVIWQKRAMVGYLAEKEQQPLRG